MGGFVYLDGESYSLIKSLYQAKVIKEEDYFELESAKSFKKTKEIIQDRFGIVDTQQKELWHHTRKRVWLHPEIEEREECTYFGRYHNIFVDFFIDNNCVVTKKQLIKKGILTGQQIRKKIPFLIEIDYIIQITTRKNYRNDTIYFLHPRVKMEMLQRGK